MINLACQSQQVDHVYFNAIATNSSPDLSGPDEAAFAAVALVQFIAQRIVIDCASWLLLTRRHGPLLAQCLRPLRQRTGGV